MGTEADTCRLYVVPKLQAAGWEQSPHSIAEQRTFTDGRLVPVGQRATRLSKKRADYLLRYTRDFTIAVVEAKALPYLPYQMDPLLHGLEAPELGPGNSLRFMLREIGDRERVDVILTKQTSTRVFCWIYLFPCPPWTSSAGSWPISMDYRQRWRR